MPQDLDGDSICDALDEDIDGDGLLNTAEDNSGNYASAESPGTNSTNADTDGDGVCDGPNAVGGVCAAGPDAFPHDAAASVDTDGDGLPDDLVDDVETDLVADDNDDGDQWKDTDEVACGTNPKDINSIPFDGDVDGLCDALDEKSLGYSQNGSEGEVFEAVINQSGFTINPNLSGMEPGTWSIYPALPAGLEFSGTMARSGETGIITGTPTEVSPMTEYTVFANNSQTGTQFTFSMAVLADTDGDGLPDNNSVSVLKLTLMTTTTVSSMKRSLSVEVTRAMTETSPRSMKTALASKIRSIARTTKTMAAYPIGAVGSSCCCSSCCCSSSGETEKRSFSSAPSPNTPLLNRSLPQVQEPKKNRLSSSL